MPEAEVVATAVKGGRMLFGISVTYYLLCGIGAFVLFFKLQKKGAPVFEVITYINPAYGSSPWCRLLEALVFSALGALIGTIITQPGNPQQAIVAGLGWTGLLSKSTV